MGNNNAKEKVDAASKMLQEAVKNKNTKIIVGVVIVVIIAFNTFWNMTESKIVSEMAPLKAQITAIGAQVTAIGERVTAIEGRVTAIGERVDVSSGTNFEALKAEIENFKKMLEAEMASLRKAGETFDVRLNAVVKSEEEKLEVLKKTMEDQNAYVEELKGLLAGEVTK